jgi:N-carbamoylputrescine amidase
MKSGERQIVRLGLIQQRIRASRAETLLATEEAIVNASEQGARFICLQELFADPYFCQVHDPMAFDLAEPSTGPLVTRFAQLAARLKVSLMIPFFERRAPGLFHNSAVVVGLEGEQLGFYRKMHIPDDPQFMEKYYFTPGDLGYMAIQTPGLKVGPLICWDQWFPEAARLTAMKGAELLVYPTAIGWLPSEKLADGAAQLDAWKTIQRAHAIANGTFVMAINRVGQEGDAATGIEFWGHSLVVDPLGRVIAEAGEEEEILIADIDLSAMDETRKWWPFFRDRRIDSFADLQSRWLEK